MAQDPKKTAFTVRQQVQIVVTVAHDAAGNATSAEVFLDHQQTLVETGITADTPEAAVADLASRLAAIGGQVRK
jgi:hypothetical protein